MLLQAMAKFLGPNAFTAYASSKWVSQSSTAVYAAALITKSGDFSVMNSITFSSSVMSKSLEPVQINSKFLRTSLKSEPNIP